MARILFKFIIHPSYERVLKHRMVKSTIFRKLSLNFSFGQGSYVILDFAQPKSVKAVLLEVSLGSEIIIFNNNFVFCQAGFLKPFMISFCSMPGVAGQFLLRETIKYTSVFQVHMLKSIIKRQIKICDSILLKLRDYTPQLT